MLDKRKIEVQVRKLCHANLHRDRFYGNVVKRKRLLFFLLCVVGFVVEFPNVRTVLFCSSVLLLMFNCCVLMTSEFANFPLCVFVCLSLYFCLCCVISKYNFYSIFSSGVVSVLCLCC